MRILIVEDEVKIANAIKKGLEQESYAVDVAYDGASGLDLAVSESYDLIILDRMLPGMDGVDVCKEIRIEGIHSPILMLTAKGLISDRVAGLDSGADDYLVKPFAFEELVARVRALTRRPPQTVGSTLRVGDLTLDTLTYEVKRGDISISLSQKEYALLEYMMRSANQVITKDQIISHVWDYEADVLPNTVEVYIGYLRNKIDKPFGKEAPLLQTIRGFGYKLGAN